MSDVDPDFDPETGEQLQPTPQPQGEPDELENTTDPVAGTAGISAGSGSEEEPAAQFENVYAFFEEVYSAYYELYDYHPGAMQQKKASLTWCPTWWEHRSVVARLVAAWYAWEEAYLEGGASMSSWILEHGNHHYDWIMAEEGPFRKCMEGHTSHLGVFPTEPSPASLRMAEPNQEDHTS